MPLVPNLWEVDNIVNLEKRILLELVFQILYEKVPVSGTEGQTASTGIILF